MNKTVAALPAMTERRSGARVLEPTALYDAEQIRARIDELSSALNRRLPADGTPHLVAVLKGGFMFLADLVRAMRRPITVDFVRIASYGSGTTPARAPRISQEPEMPLGDRDVVIVEDIVDTGETLAVLRQRILSERPASLTTVALLTKPSRRRTDVPIELAGFVVDNGFVVGYGLDLDERFRHLPFLALVDPLEGVRRDEERRRHGQTTL